MGAINHSNSENKFRLKNTSLLASGHNKCDSRSGSLILNHWIRDRAGKKEAGHKNLSEVHMAVSRLTPGSVS